MMYCAPAWCLTSRNELVAAMSPQNIKAYLSRGNRHKPLSRTPLVEKLFAGQDRLLALGYVDTPKVFELVYPWITVCNPMIVAATRIGTAVGGGSPAKIDLSLLPSAPSDSGGTSGPDLITLSRTKDGIEWTVRKTIPGMDLPP